MNAPVRLAVFSGGDLVVLAVCIAILAGFAYASSLAFKKFEQTAEEGRTGLAIGLFVLFLVLGVPLAWFLMSMQGAVTTPSVPTPVPTPMP